MSKRHDSNTHVEKGPSLAKGPAWIIGSVLAVFGLILFFKAPGSPLSTSGFSDSTVQGDTFLGFEVNAWTAWLTTAAGVLVLIGVLQHVIAKMMSLIVGIALVAAAVIALIDGNDVLGLAAANGWTALGWAVAGALLIIAALMPRKKRVVEDRPVAADRHRDHDHDRQRTIGDRDHDGHRDHDRDNDGHRDHEHGRTGAAAAAGAVAGRHSKHDDQDHGHRDASEEARTGGNSAATPAHDGTAANYGLISGDQRAQHDTTPGEPTGRFRRSENEHQDEHAAGSTSDTARTVQIPPTDRR